MFMEACVEGYPLPLAPVKEGSGRRESEMRRSINQLVLLQNKPFVAISASF
ncbi:hypothetical protein PpBr36_02369 [Pyricularia pennisetigena]|uniref:hypothetical protein n=1 Tax=Pyricularia pennisetigena TaxID=1578925 RepID=UPI001154F0B2|nr:hypothetical protein PpBr36_02369 [Pyricularia pennisetigena]TLS30291.1 hypothetical protein PpBr36_02369 [Pyricularia pennisetigena]